jgi:hypothetical protein
MSLHSDGFPKPGWAAEVQGDRGVNEDDGCGSGGRTLDGEPVCTRREPLGSEEGRLEGMAFRQTANWQNMHSWTDEKPCGGGIYALSVNRCVMMDWM